MLTVSGFQLPPMASIWILVRAVPVVCPIAVISRRCACMRWVQRWHVEWFSLPVPLSKRKKKVSPVIFTATGSLLRFMGPTYC